MVAQLKRHQFEYFLSSHGGTIKMLCLILL